MRYVLAVMLACCGFHAATGRAAMLAPDHSENTSAPTGRLPRWAVPQDYHIALRADPAASDFSGHVDIRVRLSKKTGFFWINGRDLKVSRIALTDAHGTTHAARYQTVDTQAGVARIVFDAPLPAQTVVVHIDYRAPLNTHLEGFYKVDYQGAPYAMTQMEAVSARLAFPGFDEPDFKTPFTLSLTVPKADVAVANTSVVNTRDAGQDWKTVSFATTRPLPTYLVAFAVGPWDVVPGAKLPANAWRDQAVPLRGIAAQGKGDELKQALVQTPGIITALESYYDFGYPFDKLDVLAAPDFAAGAMENAGLVTFRDWYMLLSPDSPASSVRDSFEVEAHELAHQWTGDTVTMRWWNDLWLNESFATWMQQKITGQMHPEYHADLDRITGAQGAMAEDSLTSARQIRQPIKGMGDIGNAFDSVTYQKGASVLGMFEAFVGQDTFRSGMRAYIQQHKFANATADDLIAAIDKAANAGPDFSRAFASFLNQSGVPYVRYTLASDHGKPVLDVSQTRYLPLGSTGDATRSWGLPLCVRYPLAAGGTATQCQLLDKARGRVALKGAAAKPAWVMPNAGASGYYRFALTRSQFEALGDHVDALDDGEKLAYEDSVWAAFRQDHLNAADLVTTMQKLARAKTPAVALAPLDHIDWLWQHEAATDAQREALKNAISTAYLPSLQALGYRRRPGESADAIDLRTRLASFLGVRMGIAPVVAELARQGDAVLDGADGGLDFSAADPDLLGSALAIAVRERGKPAVKALMANLAHNGDADQRNAMIAALARVQTPALRQQVRDFALTDAIKVGEMFALLSNGGRHSADQRSIDAVNSMWPWFTQHFDAIKARTGPFSGGGLPNLAAAGACSDAAADRLQAFFKPRLDDLSGARRNLAQTAEAIRLCAALKSHQDPAVLVW